MLTRIRHFEKVLLVAILLTLAVGMSACVPIQAPTTTEMEGTSVAVGEGEAAETEAAMTESSELTGILTGTDTYLQRVAMPAASQIEHQLQDDSRADAPAQILASQTITTTGENVPIPFTLSYDPAQIDPRFTYALSVRITTDGQLRWINTEHHGVLTRGAPFSGVEVVVQPVQ